jgi:hypothetical protein
MGDPAFTGIPRGSIPPGARFDPIQGVPPGNRNLYANPSGPDFDDAPRPHAYWGDI